MKTKGMTPARSGLAFLIIMLLIIGVSLIMAFAFMRGGSVQLSIFKDVMLSESMVLLPGLLIATFSGAEVGEIFRFKKIKPGTAVMVVLFIFCLEPLISAVNSISLLFSDNAAAEIAEQYINENSSFLYVLMVIGIIGPLAEELAFRGIIYAGLRKSGRIFGAIMLQAFLFGLMHLNLNQFCYAFLLGIAFGILNEMTLSLWPGIIGHIMINSGSVAGTFAIMRYMPEEINRDISKVEIMESFAFFGGLSVLFTTIAVFILFCIAHHEPGARFRLKRIFNFRDLKIINENGDTQVIKKPRVITVPVVIGIAIAIMEMALPLVPQP